MQLNSRKRSRPYFEGWYFKCRTRGGKALALIPAFHTDSTGQRSASLQIISKAGAWWLEYPETEFHVQTHPLLLSVGPSSFSEAGIFLHVEQDGLSLHGKLRHGIFTPLKSDIMGPFRFLSQMECTHGVVSMGHRLEGTLTLNGETMDFSGGNGYVETDRGHSFPSTYLWTQCSRQSPVSTGLMLAIASIPIAKGIHFTGCICAVHHNGQEYRLATYKGVRIKEWSKHGAEIVQGKYRLRMEVLAEQGQPLRAPTQGAMKRIIHESLCTKMRYRFWDGEQLLFDHTDDGASFEYAGKGSTVKI